MKKETHVMATVHSEATPANLRGSKHAEPARRRRVLACVDGTQRTNHVVDYLITLADGGYPIEVVLLNVQPQPEAWRLRGYETFKRDEVRDRLVNDLGMPIVSSAGRRLEQYGIPYSVRVELGDTAETIVRCASQERCDTVIAAEPRLMGFRQWIAAGAALLAGSLAGRLIQIADTPVVIVK
jgi:nucleotide-binding universal stress UspA family protein